MATPADIASPNRAQLERVLHSEAFRNSDSLRNLLAYLGEKSLADPAEEVKEYTIGLEACGKPSSYDPQKDASVRVQVSRLRQKIDEYYRTAGAGDPIQLELPKGRFMILYRARDSAPLPVRRVRSLNPVTLALAGALALAWGIYQARRLRDYEARLAVSTQSATMREFSPLWGPFLSHNVPTTVVFGSPPFFASQKHHLFIRMFGLANPEDPRSSPEFGAVDRNFGPLTGPRFDYASMGDAMAVQRLTAFFGSAGIPLRSLPAHLAVWESIKDGNLIFVGAWRMHPLLRRLPIQQDFELGADDQIYNRKPQAGEQPVYKTPSHRDVLTYAVVGSFPGLKPGNEVLLITAHSSPGAVGAADFITSEGNVRAIRDRIGLSPGGARKYFQMLLRIHVDNDVPVKSEYVTHHLNP